MLNLNPFDPPCITQVGKIYVVRDDLYPGGTKARFLRPFIDKMILQGVKEFVYASPCEGGAQTALCTVSRDKEVKATIVVAKRANQHPRVLLNRKLGGQVIEVPHGYLNVVQSAAAKYAASVNAYLMPFGFETEETIEKIASEARRIEGLPNIDEVWCAAGSGTLTRGLMRAFPSAKFNAVQVGRNIEIEGVKVHVYPKPFGKFANKSPFGFVSDMNYDAKAWEMLIAAKPKGNVLFWNVTGPPNG